MVSSNTALRRVSFCSKGSYYSGLMNEYLGKSRIEYERVHPKAPNSCRISVVANAINYYHGRMVYAPEQVLEIINFRRKVRGEALINPNNDTVTDEEIEFFIAHYGHGVEMKSVEGGRCMNPALWDELVANDFLIAPDHQMLYDYPIPGDLLFQLAAEREFSYQIFRELYSFVINQAKHLDEGHMDIVLDVRKVAGVDMVVLANLASRDNETPIAIPWHFLRNYLALDYVGATITDVSELPDEQGMRELFEKGDVDHAGRHFFYGGLEIYYPANKKDQLNAILAKYGLQR